MNIGCQNSTLILRIFMILETIIQHISCSDAENLPGLFAFLELDVSFDAIEATTIIPKYEIKAEASDPIKTWSTVVIPDIGQLLKKVITKQ